MGRSAGLDTGPRAWAGALVSRQGLGHGQERWSRASKTLPPSKDCAALSRPVGGQPFPSLSPCTGGSMSYRDGGATDRGQPGPWRGDLSWSALPSGQPRPALPMVSSQYLPSQVPRQPSQVSGQPSQVSRARCLVSRARCCPIHVLSIVSKQVRPFSGLRTS
jgi:hypothetical protein